MEKKSPESDVAGLNLKETELTLGLPGESRNQKSGTKRGFSKRVDDDRYLNLGSSGGGVELGSGKNCEDDQSENDVSQATKPSTAKAQVVGWPPVRSFRKNMMTTTTMATTTTKTASKYVKVAVDGAPYLRKVDLEMHSSYEQLLTALEDMFTCFTIRNYLNERKLMDTVNGSEYVPTYEDKDGDWMLVGDVPWKMFVESCKRLRLMKTNLPLAVVGSVCHSADNPFGPECYRTGVAYVSFAQWVAALLVYTLVYHMMEPPLQYYEVVEEGVENREIEEQLPVNNDLSRSLLVEAEWPGMEEKETEHCKTPFIARIFTSISQTSIPDPDILEDGGGTRSPRSIRCLAEPRMVRRIRIVAERTPIRHILQPPTIATLLAFIIGMVPPLKAFVYGDDAPLSFVLDSLEILAGAMVPAVMLILGGMLAEGPNDSKLGIRTTIGIIVARLLVLPLAGIGVVWFADRMNILIPGDHMYRFVLLLQYTTPSAILIGAIASLRGYAVSEASALLFWQHVFALFSLSMYMIIYFNLLLSYV